MHLHHLAVLGSLLGLSLTGQAARNAVARRYIVEFENENTSSADFYSHLTSLNITATPRIDFAHAFFSGASFELPANATDSGVNVNHLVSQIRASPLVKTVSPVRIYTLPPFTVNQHLPQDAQLVDTVLAGRGTETPFSTHVMTGVDKLHAQGFTGKGLVVALLDTGVDYKHPALGGCFGPGCKVAAGFDFVGDAYTGENDPVPDPDPYSNCSPHGTHVTGILAANENEFGFRGVVPDATVHMYRVFGCSGVASDDILISASLKAVDNGANVISASIGSGNGWSEEPWAVVASRINANGTIFMLATGNGGQNGAFETSTASDGIDVTAVGSVDNSAYPEFVIPGNYTTHVAKTSKKDRRAAKKAAAATSSAPAAAAATAVSTTASFGWGPGIPANFTTGTFPVIALNLDTSVVDDGCNPYPSTTPDLSSYVVLIKRGTCGDGDKATHAAAFGAKYVMLYNNVGGIDLIGAGTDIQGIGLVEQSVGEAWIAVLKAGGNVTVDIQSPATAKFQVVTRNNKETGGTMSLFSSWGPTFEMFIKPTVSAPGGNILSTWSSIYGNYAVISGTSMATPFLAGVAALIQQVRGTDLAVSTIRQLMTNTAKPLFFNDALNTTFNYLAPVFQQGGGLVDAFEASHATTLLSKDILAFNDTANIVSPAHFTITNTGSTALSYSLSNIGAGTAYALNGSSSIPTGFEAGKPPTIVPSYAHLSITPSNFVLQSKASIIITVVPTIPSGLDTKRLPLYSGFISINSTGKNSNSSSVRLPYAGVAAALTDFTVMDTSLGSPYLASSLAGTANLTSQSSPPVFTVPHDNTTDTTNVAFPEIGFTLSLGSSWLDIDIVSTQSKLSIGKMSGLTPYYLRDEFTSYFFTGQFDNGTWAPEGEYFFHARALRMNGNLTNDADYDVASTGNWVLKYST